MCRLWVPPRRTRAHPRTKPIFFSRVGVCFCPAHVDFLTFCYASPSPVRPSPVPRPSTFYVFRYNGFYRVFTALHVFAPKTNLNIAYQHIRDCPLPTEFPPNKLPQIHRAAYCVFTALVQILSK